MELHIEIDDMPGANAANAVIEFDAEYQREERDTGTPAGWYITSLEIVSWSMDGGAAMSREQLVLILGEAEVGRIEEAYTDQAIEMAADEAQARADDYADHLYHLRAEDRAFAAE